MNKKLLLLVALLALLVTISSASAQITITVNSINNKINHDETALYTIQVTNNQEFSDAIKIRAVDIKYGQLYFPEGNIANLGPGGSKTISVTFSPPKDVKMGSYALGILAISNKDPSIRGSTYLKFDIISEGPQLETTIESKKSTSPGEYIINVILKNAGTLSQENLSGKIKLFNQEKTFKINKLVPEETKLIFTDIFTIPSNALGNHIVILEISQNGEFLLAQDKIINILSTENLDILVDSSKNLLSFTNTVKITNAGNVKISDRYEASVSGFQKYFLSTMPLPLLKDYQEYTSLIWTYSLNPGESITLSYTISYLSLILLILLIVAGGFIYTKYYYNPYTITKEVMRDPHGENALKVNLHVKNHTRQDAEHVKLIDTVPTPLKLVEEFGTIEPDVIKRKGGGANMFWNLGSFAPKEERVISYKLKSSLSVLGRLRMPSAKVKVKLKTGKSKMYSSNQVFLKGKVDISEE